MPDKTEEHAGITPMDLEEFRNNAHKAIDWVVDYLGNVESYPVLSRVSPGEIRSQLPAHPPVTGESFDSILKDIDEIIMPGITHWQSPDFFAYFPCNSSPPGILADILASGLNVQGMLWATSPACTELETHMMDWLVEMIGLPDKFTSHGSGGGVIQHSGSDANLCALLAAREKKTTGQSNQNGCTGKLVAYTSAHAHSSIEKACMIAGIGRDNLRLIEVDDQFAMCPEVLDLQIRQDLDQGLFPFFICACIGTTSSLAIDPIEEIGKIAAKYGVWLHIDAAMAGTAAICPEFRFINAGVECSDSYTFNPHKWMFTNFDCTAFFVADRAALINALSILPEYLRNEATESGAVFDYRDWHIPMGRRFRALKLWFVIRQFGIEELQQRIRQHIALAQEFKNWVSESSEFELAVNAPLNLICFRHRDGDEITEQIMQRVNNSGEMYITHTRLQDRFILRMSIGQSRTERRHVKNAWQLLLKASKELAENPGV